MPAPVLQAWGLILQGRRPNLSIEITRECPLRCPGCYAYGDTHLGGDVVLRQLADFKGQELIDGMLDVVRRHKPLHLSIVGGEPLVRFRELDVLLPQLTAMGVHTQVVTSAVRPIPESWADMPQLQVCVSIDGLQPEHDVRRAPATYDRILKHIKGQHVTVHCTITRQQTRPGYVTEFTEFWATLPDVQAHLVQPVHAAEGRAVGRDAASRGSRARGRRDHCRCIAREPKLARHAAVGRARLPPAAAESGRVHLREDDRVPVGGSEAGDHAVSVRRRSGLHAVRLHGVGRAAGARRLPARRRDAAAARSSTRRFRSARVCARFAGTNGHRAVRTASAPRSAATATATARESM